MTELADQYGISYTLNTNPTCVKACPIDEDSPIECHATNEVSEEQCDVFFPTSLSAHYGYGTFELYGEFCYPDPTKMPDTIDDERYNELLGNFGVDDIQKYLRDLIDAPMSYAYSFGTCIVIALIYIILVRYFAKPLIWISIIGVGVGLIVLSLLMKKFHDDNYDNEAGDED